jgi:nicotinamide phosphoribosyltransferase
MDFFNFCPPLAHLDFYKTGHPNQYPGKTTMITSNLTPRGSRIEGCDYMVNFGLQIYLKQWLDELWGAFFGPQGLSSIDQYEEECRIALNSDDFSADYLRDLHSVGYLPICIKSLPEGTKVPMRVPAITIHNTDPRFFWLPGILETQLSTEVWKPSATATISSLYRQVFDKYHEITCDPDDSPMSFVSFQGHDFSMRGMSGVWDAAKCGMGHLLSSNGTDTLPAIYGARKFYGATGFVGGSVPATEHCIMQAGGKDNELDTIARLLDTYKTGVLAVVCDTWDFWNVVSNILPELYDKITARDGTLVIRPDSGDPIKIVCGDPDAPEGSAERAGLVQCLWAIFGGTTNSKGYKVLNSHIGCIYGDSITLARQEAILSNLEAKGFASTNVVLGIGSYTYQYITRDTFGVAVKATYAVIDGEATPLVKQPKTDDGTKNSAKGLVLVTRDEEGNLKLRENVTWSEFNSPENLLIDKWVDGKLVRDESWDDVKATLHHSR